MPVPPGSPAGEPWIMKQPPAWEAVRQACLRSYKYPASSHSLWNPAASNAWTYDSLTTPIRLATTSPRREAKRR